jgi:citrate synthase
MAKPAPKTRIATSDETTVTIRGKSLMHDLIGKLSFTEMMYFLIKHREPTPAETKVLDACLVTLMEHGFTPSALVSRMVIDSVPDQVQVAMAAGLLTIGGVFVGTMEGCAKILQEGVEKGGDLDAYCTQVVREHRAAKKAMPGFGHPFHKPDDPRPPRLFEVAKEAGIDGPYLRLLHRLSAAVDREYGRHLTINATGAIGALMLEIGIPAEIMRAIAVVSRCGGLPGHIMEEYEMPTTRKLWALAEEHIPYEPG